MVALTRALDPLGLRFDAPSCAAAAADLAALARALRAAGEPTGGEPAGGEPAGGARPHDREAGAGRGAAARAADEVAEALHRYVIDMRRAEAAAARALEAVEAAGLRLEGRDVVAPWGPRAVGRDEESDERGADAQECTHLLQRALSKLGRARGMLRASCVRARERLDEAADDSPPAFPPQPGC